MAVLRGRVLRIVLFGRWDKGGYRECSRIGSFFFVICWMLIYWDWNNLFKVVILIIFVLSS